MSNHLFLLRSARQSMTGKWTSERRNGRRNKQTNERKTSERSNRRTNGQINKRANERRTNERTKNERTNEWMKQWLNEWMNECLTHRIIFSCCMKRLYESILSKARCYIHFGIYWGNYLPIINSPVQNDILDIGASVQQRSHERRPYHSQCDKV